MKNSKKIEKLVAKLSEIQEIVSFLTNGSDRYDTDFKQLRDLIEDLALDRKENNIRLAKKLKGISKEINY